jgi:hypothetical protein
VIFSFTYRRWGAAFEEGGIAPVTGSNPSSFASNNNCTPVNWDQRSEIDLSVQQKNVKDVASLFVCIALARKCLFSQKILFYCEYITRGVFFFTEKYCQKDI